MNHPVSKYFLIFGWCFVKGLFAQSVGGVTSGAASYCSSANSGFISVSGYTGSILFWESSVNGGSTWTNIGNATSNQSYVNLTQTTCYRAVVKNGTFPADTSSVSCITIYSPTVPGTISPGGTFCGSTGPGTVTVSGNTGNVIYWMVSTDGGTSWAQIANTTTAFTYTNINTNIIFEAVVQNSSFCAADTTPQSVFIIDSPSVAGTISLSGNDSLCFGPNSGTLTLSGNTGLVTGWASSTDGGVTWTPIVNISTVQTFSNLNQTTWYEATVQSGICPVATAAPVSIAILPLPDVSAGSDTSINPGQSVVLAGNGTGNPAWSPAAGLSSTNTFSTTAAPGATTDYILTVTDPFGCSNSDTVMVIVKTPVFGGTISNYFSPNADGINDTWYIQDIMNHPDNEVFVYNIYGNKVFSKRGYANDWDGNYDGQLLPEGTYYYVVKFDNSDKVYKGSVDIIRRQGQ